MYELELLTLLHVDRIVPTPLMSFSTDTSKPQEFLASSEYVEKKSTSTKHYKAASKQNLRYFGKMRQENWGRKMCGVFVDFII